MAHFKAEEVPNNTKIVTVELNANLSYKVINSRRITTNNKYIVNINENHCRRALVTNEQRVVRETMTEKRGMKTLVSGLMSLFKSIESLVEFASVV